MELVLPPNYIAIGFRIPIKHTNEIIPRLELGSVNGKFFYNIDYYPMIFDPKLTANDEDFIEAIENIITVYRVWQDFTYRFR
jgi:hypothetical protein